MKKNIFGISVSLIMIFSSSCKHKYNKEYKFSSPNSQIEVTFDLNDLQQPVYSINYKSFPVVVSSTLGIKLENENELSKNFSLYNVKESFKDETYKIIAGKTKSARNHFLEKTFYLKETINPYRELQVIFRIYNDGVAFRYHIPKQKAISNYNVVKESSNFNLVSNVDFWLLKANNYKTNYESYYEHTSFDKLKKDQLIGLPVTFKIDNKCAGIITEAALKNYAGLFLQKQPDKHDGFGSILAPHPKNEDIAVMTDSSILTPWRVIMLADNELNLINSNLITNLNEPCKLNNTDWIKPGKSAWDWWSGQTVAKPYFNEGMNNRTMKHYIDFAGEFGLEYMLIDAGWYGGTFDTLADITTCIPEIDMQELIEYGNEKNVDIHIWLHWKTVRDQMDKAFSLYEEWGVKGVKIDYMDANDQQMVNFYHKVLKKAAQHKLMVNLHGAYKPTGIRRTYPNLMTREAVLGLEYCKFSDKITSTHNVTLPFTRMVIGPMDYTPGGFNNVKEKYFKVQNKKPLAPTTRCQQLAMFVVYDSPLQMVCDYPGAYRNERESEFIREVPASWDKTYPIKGEIGNYIILARKKGTKWFLGGITDTTARSFSIPLNFLEKDSTYNTTIYEDHKLTPKYPKAVNIRKTSLTNVDTIQIKMAANGGFAGIIQKK